MSQISFRVRMILERGDTMLKFIGNVLFFIFGGLIDAIAWGFIGILWSLTIIGIPIGMQCFKMAKLHIWPFGRKIVYSSSGSSLLLNILWIIFGGIPIAAAELASGIFLCMTIVGIPFGIQQFKLAMVALMPFGTKIMKSDDFFVAIER